MQMCAGPCFCGGLFRRAFAYSLCGFSKILIKPKNVGVSISAAASQQTADLNRMLTNTRGPHIESESDTQAFGPGVDYNNMIIIIYAPPRSPQMNTHTHTLRSKHEALLRIVWWHFNGRRHLRLINASQDGKGFKNNSWLEHGCTFTGRTQIWYSQSSKVLGIKPNLTVIWPGWC